ncbi:Prophage Clp protease-like protein [Streptococcus oralis]|uniref:ATP-dependent Clp protease proteolytic subunit n=1 Tax=Streptococcus oralis TaxID=1303 RepID=A0A139RIQ1_STROR|nr:head maturation protease, ClpP-related [Streptococcus oralis]KXU14604.1 Prophage Clp protease-like protein [Streptococcus oralis]
MKVIPIKGAIVSNNDRWFYDWLDMDATAPRDVVLPESGEDVEVHINSGGGDVYAGSEIYTALRAYAGHVTVKIVGVAASAASVIAMAGDVVEISPTAQLMIHNVSAGVRGDHHALLHEAGVLEGFNKSIASSYVAKTGMSEADLLALMDKETWFDAKSAVEHGFADKVMFEADSAPMLVASSTPVIPHDFIEKLQGAMAPDVDKLVDLVAERLDKRESSHQARTEEESTTVATGWGRFAY